MTLITVLIVLAGLCAFFVIYPYLIYPVILRSLRTQAIQVTGPRPRSVTLVFCAFNEGAALETKLANIESLKVQYSDLEVLAYNDASTDDTLQRLSARPDLIAVVNGDSRRGKAHGMKRLATLARGEILVFTDANVLLRDDAIDNLLTWYQDQSVGGVCGTLRYLNAADSATASVGGAYWRLEEKLKSFESRTGNVMGADGSIFSIRKELYPDFPDSVLDDLTVSMATVFAGTRLVKVDNVVAFERLVSDRKDEFARKVRISTRAFHTHRYLRPQLRKMSRIDKFKYASRKIVRWFGGLFLILGAACAVFLSALVSPWFTAGLVAIISAVGFFASRVKFGAAGIVADVVLALLATQLGVIRAMRGQTQTTWSPAKSR